MHRFVPYIFYFLVLCASCTESPDKHFLTVETTKISFSAGQDTKIISCTSNTEIEVVSSQPAWCSARVIVGKNSAVIEIGVQKNVLIGQERTASITVSAGNAETVQIEVKQGAIGPYISIDNKDKALTFEQPSDKRQITVNTNVDFTATPSQTWCTAEINKNVHVNNLTVSVTDNDRIVVRTAEIVVAATGFDDIIVTVSQDGSIITRPGMTVNGWVSCNNTGVPDVVISDGYEVTVTDADGVYYLPSQKRNGYVFISIPGNYEPPVVGNIPQFFKRLKADANTEERVDFELTRVNNEQHTVLAVADWHLANRNNDLAQFNTCLADMNSLIDKYQSEGTKTYVLTLGDMTWETYWYTTGYSLPQYAARLTGLKTCVFNVMGNHDNDPYRAGDWFAEQTFKNIIGPTWYSFNLGKAHYVVLDNIVYNNNGASQGVVGDRTYTATITNDQLEWLRKDLATVADKSAPLFIAMHIPLYQQPSVNNSSLLNLTNGQQLVTALSGFTNVHVLSGHTHVNYTRNPNSWLMEHNIAAISATWWWTGSNNHAGNHICKDGSVGGYGVYEINGKDLEWYYKSVGYDRNYQFRTYDRNAILVTATKYAPAANPTYAAKVPTYADPYHTASSANEVFINVWGYDPNWTIEVTEGAVSLLVTRVSIKDPLHIISYNLQRLNRNTDPTADFVTSNTSHIFRVTAQSPTSTLNIKVTDRFGKVYTENMTRPKELTVNMK